MNAASRFGNSVTQRRVPENTSQARRSNPQDVAVGVGALRLRGGGCDPRSPREARTISPEVFRPAQRTPPFVDYAQSNVRFGRLSPVPSLLTNPVLLPEFR